MTHFRTYCIGSYDEKELYDKFCESVEVEPYNRGKVSDGDIVSFVDWYTKKGAEVPASGIDIVDKLGQKGRRFVKMYMEGKKSSNEALMKNGIANIMKQVFDRLYGILGNDWNGNRWGKNPDGVWEEWSTYNPNTVFDYFSPVRCEQLKDIEDPVSAILNSCGFFVGSENTYTRFEDVGWFGFSKSVMDDEDKRELVKKALEGLPPDTKIYMFDCHI